jgi:hypothetical protein
MQAPKKNASRVRYSRPERIHHRPYTACSRACRIAATRGIHAGPDVERPRALVQQHAQPVGRLRAARLAPPA